MDADMASATLTTRELQARARAEELRKELLRRSAEAKSTLSASGAGICAPPGNWGTPEPSSASATGVASDAATSAAAVQPPTESAAPTPRNLAGALQDAATDTGSLSHKNQLVHSKNRMLEQLTKQMQVCLERVQDPRLEDASREKYQNLAISIRTQLDSISSIRCPAGSPMARGGC